MSERSNGAFGPSKGEKNSGTLVYFLFDGCPAKNGLLQKGFPYFCRVTEQLRTWMSTSPRREDSGSSTGSLAESLDASEACQPQNTPLLSFFRSERVLSCPKDPELKG